MVKHLCSSQIPVTDDLFGGDLHKVMKEIAESQKMVIMFRGRGRGRGPTTVQESFQESEGQLLDEEVSMTHTGFVGGRIKYFIEHWKN